MRSKMKSRISLFMTLVLVFISTFSSFSYADSSKDKELSEKYSYDIILKKDNEYYRLPEKQYFEEVLDNAGNEGKLSKYVSYDYGPRIYALVMYEKNVENPSEKYLRIGEYNRILQREKGIGHYEAMDKAKELNPIPDEMKENLYYIELIDGPNGEELRKQSVFEEKNINEILAKAKKIVEDSGEHEVKDLLQGSKIQLMIKLEELIKNGKIDGVDVEIVELKEGDNIATLTYNNKSIDARVKVKLAEPDYEAILREAKAKIEGEYEVKDLSNDSKAKLIETLKGKLSDVKFAEVSLSITELKEGKTIVNLGLKGKSETAEITVKVKQVEPDYEAILREAKAKIEGEYEVKDLSNDSKAKLIETLKGKLSDAKFAEVSLSITELKEGKTIVNLGLKGKSETAEITVKVKQVEPDYEAILREAKAKIEGEYEVKDLSNDSKVKLIEILKGKLSDTKFAEVSLSITELKEGKTIVNLGLKGKSETAEIIVKVEFEDTDILKVPLTNKDFILVYLNDNKTIKEVTASNDSILVGKIGSDLLPNDTTIPYGIKANDINSRIEKQEKFSLKNLKNGEGIITLQTGFINSVKLQVNKDELAKYTNVEDAENFTIHFDKYLSGKVNVREVVENGNVLEFIVTIPMGLGTEDTIKQLDKYHFRFKEKQAELGDKIKIDLTNGDYLWAHVNRDGSSEKPIIKEVTDKNNVIINNRNISELIVREDVEGLEWGDVSKRIDIQGSLNVGHLGEVRGNTIVLNMSIVDSLQSEIKDRLDKGENLDVVVYNKIYSEESKIIPSEVKMNSDDIYELFIKVSDSGLSAQNLDDIHIRFLDYEPMNYNESTTPERTVYLRPNFRNYVVTRKDSPDNKYEYDAIYVYTGDGEIESGNRSGIIEITDLENSILLKMKEGFTDINLVDGIGDLILERLELQNKYSLKNLKTGDGVITLQTGFINTVKLQVNKSELGEYTSSINTEDFTVYFDKYISGKVNIREVSENGQVLDFIVTLPMGVNAEELIKQLDKYHFRFK